MKKSILLLAILGLLFSCHKNEEELAPASLAGTWKLTEVLADIGDGKGTFQPVSSNKNIVFVSDNKVTSNGQICDFSIESNSSSTATYSEATHTINCQNRPVQYELNGNTLILSYLCIEGCQAKYIKVP
ncbi:MAG: lipocalin family protein [Flavobacterium sp.]|nr:lipocalin family protein [Flavobacterium sp.]